MKSVFAFFLFVITLSTSYGQVITVLIDPGHGGNDPGHESVNKAHLAEKDLNLIIAKKFGTYLSENLTNVNVIYTRTDDTYPSLSSRVEMANSRKVDYFISIHCNGSPNTLIKGTESHVHVMGPSKSVRLANTFETEFKTKAGRRSRGVKDSDDREYSLQVLKFTQMTSVLVECGFLTNPTEAAYLNTNYGQEIIASALFRGMRTFLKAQHPSISFVKSTKAVTTKSAAKGQYTVQIMSSKEWLDTEKGAFTKLNLPVERTQVATSGYKYRFTVGNFETKAAAETYLEEVKKKGFPDSMVIVKK